jgi:hypothetical protein
MLPVLGNAASSWDEHMDRHLGFPQSVLLADCAPLERVQWLLQGAASTQMSEIYRRKIDTAIKGAGNPYRRPGLTSASA